MKFLSLNHYWRILATVITYTTFGLGAFVPCLYAIVLFFLPMTVAEKQRHIRRCISKLFRFFIDMMQFLGLMNYHIEQKNNLPVLKHIVIANHPTLIDAAFALAYIDNLCCIVKKPLTRNLFTCIPIKLAGYISNDAENLVELAVEKLQAGENILIFPEGTRNEYDNQLDFKRGAANIAIIANSRILPVVISCLPRALQKHKKWYQLPTVKSHVLIRILPSMSIEESIDTSGPRTLQYRRLTEFWKKLYLKEIQHIKSNS